MSEVSWLGGETTWFTSRTAWTTPVRTAFGAGFMGCVHAAAENHRRRKLPAGLRR
jgi:hypothetical protein